MQLACPSCGTKSNELIECDEYGSIGCGRCMRKTHGKWICYKCEEPVKKYYPEVDQRKEEEVSNAFSAMFG